MLEKNKNNKTAKYLGNSSFPCRMLPHSSYGSTRMLAATVHARRRRQYLCPTMTTREMRRRRGRQRPHRWRQRRPRLRLVKTLLSPSQSIPTKLTTPMSRRTSLSLPNPRALASTFALPKRWRADEHLGHFSVSFERSRLSLRLPTSPVLAADCLRKFVAS